jgi:hypothetical protein
MGGLCISASSLSTAHNIIDKKIEAADKTGVLSLIGLNLYTIPERVFK